MAEKKASQVVNDCSAGATTLALGAGGQNQTAMWIMIDYDYFGFDDGVDYDNRLRWWWWTQDGIQNKVRFYPKN